MSRMADELTLPDGFPLPEPLARAWDWMEAQGWGESNEHGYFVTPYAGDDQLGMVFSPTESTEGWITPGAPGSERLVAMCQISADGGTGAMWLDEAGEVRFVALGSDGELFRLADSAVDFLRLAAIGYDEIVSWTLGEEPEDDDAVEAHAPFRAWVEEEFDVDVPDTWDGPEDDGFSEWVWAHTTA